MLKPGGTTFQRAVLLAIALGTAILLSACGRNSLAPVEEGNRSAAAGSEASHLVKRGDTLYAIAWRYGLNYKDLAIWNRLASPDRIYAGQRLRLKPPEAIASTQAATTAQKATDREEASGMSRPSGLRDWSWPTDGRVVRGYQPDVPGGKGIEIGGQPGQPVRAASLGQVVYSGSGLPGYGRLIIVKHSDSFLSAYGYLGRILVQEGDRVQMGQSIAELGTSGEPILHFEIRQHGKPVNPLRFLPTNVAAGG